MTATATRTRRPRKPSGKPAPAPAPAPAPEPTRAAIVDAANAKVSKPKVTKPVQACWCGCGLDAKPGRHFVQGHDARHLPYQVRAAAERMFADQDAREKALALIRKNMDKLKVWQDMAADSVRHRDEEGVDWANMDSRCFEFTSAVAELLVSQLWETSE